MIKVVSFLQYRRPLSSKNMSTFPTTEIGSDGSISTTIENNSGGRVVDEEQFVNILDRRGNNIQYQVMAYSSSILSSFFFSSITV